VFGVLIVAVAAGHAETFTVDSLADTHDTCLGDGVCDDASYECTLRAAVEEANALPGADVIVLPSGTYAVASDLLITESVSLFGEATPTTIIDGSAVVQDQTIEIGLDDEVLAVSIIGVTVRGNQHGCAIDVGWNADVELVEVAVTDNSRIAVGGGIVSRGQLSMDRCTVSNNHSSFGGGGVAVRHGRTNMVNCTISGNSGDGFGGGISLDGGAELHLDGVLVTANTSDADESGSGTGGGIIGFNGTTVYLHDSIVAGNTDRSGTSPDLSGDVVSEDFNIVGDTTGAAVAGPVEHCVFGQPVPLGPLADNGGPTLTHALLVGNPAIDAGDPGSNRLRDQRWLERPQGAAGDIGPFELAYGIFADGFESGEMGDWVVVR
jgi:CSLREA domain-containing protein